MKKRLLYVLFIILSSVFASAQTQSGYVKTKGRMDSKGNLIPGTRIGGAAITLAGGHSTVADVNGNFKLTVPDKKYYLQNVQKQGYVLVDPEVLSKQYVCSSNPLVISMETPEKMQADQLASERKIRRELQKKLQQQEREIDSLLEHNKLTEEEYRQALRKLYSDQENKEKLISDMAKRYTEIDYDLLDEFYREVSFCIENGYLTKADSLLRSRGDVIQQVEDHKRKETAIKEVEKELQQAKAIYTADNEELARRCYSYYETFLAQFQFDSAAFYLGLSANLDTLNFKCQRNAGLIYQKIHKFEKAKYYYQRVSSLLYEELKNHDYKLPYNLFDLGLEEDTIENFYYSIGIYDTALIWMNLKLRRLLSLFSTMFNLESAYSCDTMVLDGVTIVVNCDYSRDALISEDYNNQQFPEYMDELVKMWIDQHKYYWGKYNTMSKVSDEFKLFFLNTYYFSLHDCTLFSLGCKKSLSKSLLHDIALCHKYIGFEYHELGEFSKAIKSFLNSLFVCETIKEKNNSNIAEIYNNLAYSYASTKEYSKSISAINNAIKLMPDDPNYYDTKGEILLMQGDEKGALKMWKKVLKLDADYEKHLEEKGYMSNLYLGLKEKNLLK
jgi:tetratricopeptide (TPR) repeat protein